MQLIEHDLSEVREQPRPVFMRQQQRELFRRCQQDMRRFRALALAFRRRRIAAARFDRNVEPHLRNRRRQVAGNIDGQRLKRRDVERVKARTLPRRGIVRSRQLDQARQEPGKRLARPRRRDQKRIAPGVALRDKAQLVRPRLPAAPFEPVGDRSRQR